MQREPLGERRVQLVHGNDFFGGGFRFAHDFEQHAVQLALLDRLGQAGGKWRGGTFQRARHVPHRSEQDHRQRFRPPQFSNLASERYAVHFRHLHVQHREVERFVLPQQIQRLVSAVNVARQHAPLARLQRENTAVGRVIVHDEQPHAGQLRLGAFQFRLRGARCRLHLNGELKGGTFADRALDPHSSTHQLGQALADGQSESRSTVVTRRRSVHLAE